MLWKLVDWAVLLGSGYKGSCLGKLWVVHNMGLPLHGFLLKDYQFRPHAQAGETKP